MAEHKIQYIKVHCECGGKYIKNNKTIHCRSKKHNMILNTPENIVNNTIYCNCGGKYRTDNKSTHLKSEKHNLFLSTKNNIDDLTQQVNKIIYDINEVNNDDDLINVIINEANLDDFIQNINDMTNDMSFINEII